MSSSHERCILHPQRRLVGICAHCLRERLTCLIESTTPADAHDGGHADEAESYGADMSTLQPTTLRTYCLSHERPSKSLHANIKASAEMGLQSYTNLEDSLNSALQKVRHAHQQLSFVAQAPYQGVVKVAPAGSPLFSSIPNEKPVSVPISRRRSNASESEMKTFPGGLGVPAKKSSWFSMSKAKGSTLSSPFPQGASKLDDKQKSPQAPILAGRKSASDAIGASCNKYRQAYMADLEAIAEINIGEAAMKARQYEGNAEVHGNSSWISSLFHRRKGPRHKSDAQSHVGNNATDADGMMCSSTHNDSVYRLPPKNLTNAGRHSVDGDRPNFKQILKKIEARNKQQQRVDCSPLRIPEYLSKQQNGTAENILLGQAAVLQKCKSAASARSSISIDPPSKNYRQLSPLPVFQSNGSSEVGYGNGDANRSRSWGKAWNKTLSPLLGLKQQGRRSVQEPPQYQHPGFATPDHTILKNSMGVSPTPSSYISPLRRSRRAPDAHIQFAQ